MARTWASGTAVDGGGSTPTNAATVQSALRDAIVANAAWSLVEEIAGTQWRVVVMKCNAASSGLPSDFYVAIWRELSTGNLFWAIGEGYSTGTHVLSGVVPASTGATRVIDANGIVTTNPPTVTFNAATGVPASAFSPLTNSVAMAASAFWSAVVDVDQLVITVRTTSSYIGAFTSLASVADTMPLGLFLCSGTSTPPNSNSGVIRNPGGTSPVFAGSFNTYDLIGIANLFVAGPTLPFASVDKLQNNLPHAYEVSVLHQLSQSANAGYLRGKLKSLAVVLTGPAGVAVGDTFTMAGHTWIVVGINGTNCCIVDTGS